MDGDHPALLARVEDLMKSFGPTLSENLKPDNSGRVVITPAIGRQIKRDFSAQAPPLEVKPPARLDYAGNAESGRFIFNGKAVESPTDRASVTNDARLITQYFNKLGEFGLGAETLQRNYYAFMGWLYFAPFMPLLRRERNKEGPGNSDCKLMALIYGPVNAGKSGMVSFLRASMFGNRRSYSDRGKPGFTPTGVRDLRRESGLLPLFLTM